MLSPFGSYLLVRKLAEGGMAEIFLAKHVGAEGFERDVVIKRMLDSLARSKPFVTMFLDEARLAARLSHPNIVQITDLGQADGAYFICMEYLPGEDLDAIVARARERSRPVPFGVAARIALGACEGLEFAHAYGESGRPVRLVHRDVNPSNILVTYQGAVKLLDFGIAKAESSAGTTSRGTLKGKWMFMAPEQARGEEIDARADLYSLGLSLHELLTSKRVFERDNELAVLGAVLDEPVPSPRALRPEVPAALEAIVMKAVERDLRRRYPGAGAMRSELEAFLAQLPGGASARQVGEYLSQLFSPEEIRLKTQIPTLAELRQNGAQFHPSAPPAKLLATPAPAAPKKPAALPPTASRWPAVLLGALGSVALLAAGGGAVIYLRPSAPPPLAPVAPAPTLPAAPSPAVAAAPISEAPSPAASPKPATPPRPAQPGPNEPITASEIAKVVSRSSREFQGCLERHRAELGSEQGQVTLSLTIDQTGAVRDAHVSTAGLGSTPLAECMVAKAKALKFRRHPSPKLTIELPFAYRPG
ncbi:MAG: serine/threonine protein kinase [Myxococcales bacterium]|nr:serine/threonine protein kinase [Myxococcales bacterium]